MSPNATHWSSTHSFGKRQEQRFVALHDGWNSNTDKYATDAVHDNGAKCEIKSVRANKPATEEVNGELHLRYHFFDLTRPAFDYCKHKRTGALKKIPFVRITNCFRTEKETPFAFFVIVCPAKPQVDLPERIYYYRAMDLVRWFATEFTGLIRGPAHEGEGFKTTTKVAMRSIRHLEISRSTFMREVEAYSEASQGARAIRSNEADALWVAVLRKSFRALKCAYKSRLRYYLSLDRYNERIKYLRILDEVEGLNHTADLTNPL